jgi:16S rRNA A1518/A1519 N6-dimethyltransferase RsmA/KsgA/DIM1 with predicted DNA glycosylase/AP lyase activity
MKADTIESLKKKKKEMISMLQLLPAAMSFPSSSRSKSLYKAWCTVCNHAYENRKKMLRKNIKHNMQKKMCMESIDIFDAETLNGQRKHSCCFLKH